MGFGSTAKKIQKLADTAEKLYSKLNELREQVVEMRDTLEATNERVETLEKQAAEQRALVEAIAEAQGIDSDEIADEVAVEIGDGDEAESDEPESDEAQTEA